MTIVVDSSVAAKWFLEEPGSAEAEVLQIREHCIAPELIILEVLNAIWKNIRRKRVVPAQMKSAALALPAHFASIFPVSLLAVRAAEIAVEADHPIYDCVYLSLAERESCPLVTADDRFYRKTRGTKFARIVNPLLKVRRGAG